MQKNNLAIGVVIVTLVLLGFAAWQYWPSPTLVFDIPIAEGDSVSSWNYRSAYTGNLELETRAHTEIARLKKLFGSKEYTDYILYVSIANQYGLLGDGVQELEYLEKALAIESEVTGLAWHNAGQLFARLGAYNTARMALEKAAAAQPITQYQRALVDFLTEHFPGDAAIQAGQQAIQQSPGEATD